MGEGVRVCCCLSVCVDATRTRLHTFITIPKNNLIGIYRDNHGQSSTVESSNDGGLFGGDCGHIVNA